MLLTGVGLLAHEFFSTSLGEQGADLELALVSLLDRMTPSVLQIEKPPIAPIEYCQIFNDQNFTVSAFVIRKGEKMPIHNHPNMTVFTKLVYGSLHVKTFQLVDESVETDIRKALIIDDKICSATNPKPASRQTELYSSDTIFKIVPRNGPNLHTYTAVSDYAVILDIMGPPYVPGERDITYFFELPSYPLLSSSAELSLDSLIPTPTVAATTTSRTPNLSKRKRENNEEFDNPAPSASPLALSLNKKQIVASTQSDNNISSTSSTLAPAPSATSSGIRGEENSPASSRSTFAYLMVDPTGERECTEFTYLGIPMRDYMKLFDMEAQAEEDRVSQVIKISHSIIHTCDRLLAKLVSAKA